MLRVINVKRYGVAAESRHRALVGRNPWLKFEIRREGSRGVAVYFWVVLTLFHLAARL